MPKKENDFIKKLLATFKIEAEDHIKAISSGLIGLEKETDADEQIKLIETIFREAHSLKGAARAVNNSEIERLCQSLENIFSKLKNRKINLSVGLFDLFHLALNYLNELLATTDPKKLDELKLKTNALAREMDNAVASSVSDIEIISASVKKDQPFVPEKHLSADTVRIPISQLDSVLLQSEELLSSKLTSAHQVSELHEINSSFTSWKKNWAKVKSINDTLPNEKLKNQQHSSDKEQLKDLLSWNEDFIKSLESKIKTLEEFSSKEQRSLSGMIDNLLSDMKKTLMMPFSSLLEIFPKLVRDLSKDKGKECDLIIRGSEIEVDRRILEEIKDPLIHLVRNCIDHGIEKPSERKSKQKPTKGTITIDISQKNGNKIEVLVSDDGVGIDLNKTKSSALKLGIISKEESDKLNDQEVLELIFQSGITTSTIITELSGRGLGLAIVREKVEKIGGAVSVDSTSDVGTSFRMILPITLATFRGILIKTDDRLFILPAILVEKVVRVNKDDIKTVENRETILFNGQAVSMVRLNDVLGFPSKVLSAEENEFLPVVVIKSSDKRIAFLVDEILGEQEVLVKRLGGQLSRVRNIGGASVLGTGEVVPILNVTDLMKSAVKATALQIKPIAESFEKISEKKKSILVVEDSITARTLLKNILETSGYEVKTAVDGVDAYTQLRSSEFDIVVSDVDMPRMSGFDLTAKIRADKKLTELPVVLVTALETREDREHGIDVGANAYIVKSSFDQSNLLEVIRQLI